MLDRYVNTNGEKGVPPSGPTHSTPSTAFDWAGQIVMRSGYDANATWIWFDNGPYGSSGHAHRDKLGSFVFVVSEGMTIANSFGTARYF